METSDSENFESADEDFNLDNENITNKSDVLKNKPQHDTKLPQFHVADCPEGIKKLPETTTSTQTVIPLNEVVNETGDAKYKDKSIEDKQITDTKTTFAPKPKSKLGMKVNNLQERDKEQTEEKDNPAPSIQIENLKVSEEPLVPEEEEENMWADDESWEPIEPTNSKTDPISEPKQSKTNPEENSWTAWGNWSSSLLSSASTFTNQFSQGLTTVLENSIGVPDPEELAKLDKAEQVTNADEQTLSLNFGLGNLVSGVTQITKIVENTSNKVITGGLDTLEAIGKKTMEVLQDGDPGLKKKRAFLTIEPDKHILSRVLREAKEKAEEENKLLQQKHKARRANFETLFDDHQGLVHLEALEMLSRQCDIKLQTLMEIQQGSALTETQETMAQVQELCELTEEEFVKDEVKSRLETAVVDLNVAISYDKLITVWNEAEDWLEKLNINICNENELYEQAIDTLAQLTSIAVEQFHKAGELLLLKEHHSTADEADSLVQLTSILTSLISSVATEFANKLNQLTPHVANKDELNNLITNVYYESANSSTYIKDAFKLLIPVLQHGVV